MKSFLSLIASFLLFCEILCTAQVKSDIRFATFNVSMYRDSLGKLEEDLITKDNIQLKTIAEIIQINEPDILALQEFDYTDDNRFVKLFNQNYLQVSQNNKKPIHFSYCYAFESNTGIITDYDLDNDGKYQTANDALGYGIYPGQYAFAVFSKYPIDKNGIRTLRTFLWEDMPDAHIPTNPNDGKLYYTPEELNIFRLSSKNHVDIPVIIGKDTIHFIVAHPTPPVFDGPEDRNGKRNHDEIRLIADYISGGNRAEYIYDDNGIKGGLRKGSYFVIAGDMNADPVDGDSYHNAICQLIDHELVSDDASNGKFIPKSIGSKEKHEKKPDNGDPFQNTCDFGLRIDYVLPSSNLKILNSGVFWPGSGEKFNDLISNKATDHRLVWVDIQIK